MQLLQKNKSVVIARRRAHRLFDLGPASRRRCTALAAHILLKAQLVLFAHQFVDRVHLRAPLLTLLNDATAGVDETDGQMQSIIGVGKTKSDTVCFPIALAKL